MFNRWCQWGKLPCLSLFNVKRAKTCWSIIETSLDLPRKSLDIFGNLLKITENDRKRSFNF